MIFKGGIIVENDFVYPKNASEGYILITDNDGLATWTASENISTGGGGDLNEIFGGLNINISGTDSNVINLDTSIIEMENITYGNNTNTDIKGLILGDDNTNDGIYNIISGKSNTHSGNINGANIITGSNNQNIDGSGNIITGIDNINIGTASSSNGYTNIIFGNSNENFNSNNTLLGGLNNYNSAIVSMMNGVKNNNSGISSLVSGKSNTNSGANSLVIGNGNINGDDNTIMANHFTITDPDENNKLESVLTLDIDGRMHTTLKSDLQRHNFITANFNTTLTENKNTIVNCFPDAFGSFTVTLPNSSTITSGTTFTIKNASPSDTVTIETDGSQEIDGSSSDIILSAYQVITIYSAGLNWFKLSEIM